MHDTHELLRAVGGRPISDVMTDEVPNFLFNNCFRDRSITVFVAPPHRGKTLLMLDMALCLDMEIPLMNRFAPLSGRESFFLGCDAPSWDYGLQMRKLCIGHGIDASKRALLGVNGVWRRGFKITDADVQKWLSQWKEASGANVLFIDTHRATHRADENNSSEMERVWDMLCTMRDRGWCIIMSHHTSKPTEVVKDDVHSARGSSVIGASADFIYTLNKRNRKDPRVQVSCVKGRGAMDGDDPFSFFDITPVESNEMLQGRPLWGIRLTTGVDNAIDVIEQHLSMRPCTRTDLAKALEVQCADFVKTMDSGALYRYVDNRLQELRKLNKAVQVSHGVWRSGSAKWS